MHSPIGKLASLLACADAAPPYRRDALAKAVGIKVQPSVNGQWLDLLVCDNHPWEKQAAWTYITTITNTP